jgi:kanamycin kinase
MTRTLIDKIPGDLPEELQIFAEGAKIFDSSCSPEARVYFIDKDGGVYLKRASRGTLGREAEMTAYFHKKGLGAEVLYYNTGAECDWFMTRRVSGEDCTDGIYLENPKKLAALLGEQLRALHELSATDCPCKQRTEEYLALARKNYTTGNYDTSQFPDSFGYKSAEEARDVLSEGAHLLRSEVLVHGDYCLPNIMLDDWRLSGFIDLGNAGIADRHIDLFWGAWTLGFNLKHGSYEDIFFDAYGRDKVDKDILKIIAAAEVFG